VRSLNRHLRTDCKVEKVRKWYEALQTHLNNKEKKLDENYLLLVKYFISSNTSLCELANPYLQELLGNTLKLPGVFCFRTTVLPMAMNVMHKLLENKLQAATSCCLVVDIWTNKVNTDFIGLAAIVSNKNMQRDLVVLDLMRMPGNHSAETVKIAVEKMINRYNFNKSIIHGKFFDSYLEFFLFFHEFLF
jgi:hypothetical protein